MRRIFGLFVGALAVLSTSCEKGGLVASLEGVELPGRLGFGATAARLRPVASSAREAVGTLLEEQLLREIADQEALAEAERVDSAPEPTLVVDSADRAEAALTHGASLDGPASEDDSETDLERLEQERAGAVDDVPRLASIARETWIYAEPKPRARRVGYLRAGAVVPRSREPVGTNGCKGGWYRVSGLDARSADETSPLGGSSRARRHPGDSAESARSARSADETSPLGGSSRARRHEGHGFVCLGRSASLNPYVSAPLG